MLGYITSKEAKARGFTHHARYFGIPIWFADEGEGAMIAVKWAPLEYVMDVFQGIEGVIAEVMYPDAEPAFQFSVGKPIA